MTIEQYIDAQPTNRQHLLRDLHGLILNYDRTVVAEVSNMMGKRMILYHQDGYFKYGLSGETKLLALHCMPMYCNKALRDQFSQLLNNAKFQKGCINFISEQDLQMAVIADLIDASAKVNIPVIMSGLKQRK